MTKRKESVFRGVVNTICCGLDVHKNLIVGCMVYIDERGEERQEIREFGTFTDDLITLLEWIESYDCPIVAMESTGIYWRPVYNILEPFVKVLLANARHIKRVPGRKTDVADSEWLAGLLRNGLVPSSFIPEREEREWRTLTRLRAKLVGSQSDFKRRIQEHIESANIRTDSVVSDLFGVSGRNILELLASGKKNITEEDIERCVRGKLRGRERELWRSVQGFLTEVTQFGLCILLNVYRKLEEQIAEVDRKLSLLMAPQEDLMERLCEIPGIGVISARAILAEIGVSLEAFPSAGHLAAWSGMCPGNNESAGKRKGGKNGVWKHPLKTILVEVAWGSIKKKGSYYRDKYYRVKGRRGSNRALVAVGHRILKAIYHIIKEGVRYRELGENYLLERRKDQNLKRLSQQAELLGYTLVPVQ